MAKVEPSPLLEDITFFPNLTKEKEINDGKSRRFSIPLQGKEETKSCRRCLFNLFHSHQCEVILMFLLVIDVLILFTELFIAGDYPACHIIEKHAISCCPADSSYYYRALSNDGSSHDNLCDNGNENHDYDATCDPHANSAVHTIHDILFGTTIVILSVFLIELNVTMIVLGPSKFFVNFFYTFDYIVVTVAFISEVTFRILEKELTESFVGVIVIFRLWRFVRIGHGLFEVSSETSLEKCNEMEEEMKELKSLLLENGIDLPK